MAAARSLDDGAKESKESSALYPHGRIGQATNLDLTLNLITCGLGTGIFTLPWSTAGASIVPGVAIIAGVLVLNAFTISIIVEAGERHKAFDLGSLLGCLPGRLGTYSKCLCNVVLWFSTFLCLIGYIVVMVDCLQEAVVGFRQLHRSALVLISSLLVLPLCFLDQRRLSTTSMIAVVANVNIFALVSLTFGHVHASHEQPRTCYFGLAKGSIAMLSAMMQTIVIQMCVLPMYAEMKDRSVEKFNRVVAVSFSILFLLCAGFASVGYLTFGATVSSNVLLNLPTTHWGMLARLCAAAAVAGVYPIILAPMIASVRGSRSIAALAAPNSEVVPTVVTCVVVVAVMFAAFQVRSLGFVNVVNGAVSMGTFVGIIPCLVGLKLLGEKSQAFHWRMGMYVLCTFGTVFSVLGLMLTDNYAGNLQSSCSWVAGSFS